VRDFVPRFATRFTNATSRRTAACYSYLWSRIAVERVFGRTVEEEVRSFAVKTGVDVSQLGGRLVLDAGSGPGSTIKQLGSRGAHAVGADLVVPDDAGRAERAHEYQFVQCDITAPPFRHGMFDVVYSIGVIHHLTDWREAVQKLAQLTRKPAGQLSVWVYDRDRARFIGLDDALRWFTSRLPNPIMHRLAEWVAPALPVIRRLQGARPRPIASNDRVHIVFDWLKVPHRSFHRERDLQEALSRDEWELAYRSPHSLGLSFRHVTVAPPGEAGT
jgi:SAM-dependent methyltransferase